MQFDCGTRILRVISRAGRPCHLSKLQVPHTSRVLSNTDSLAAMVQL